MTGVQTCALPIYLFISYFTKTAITDSLDDIKEDEEAEEFDNLLSKFPKERVQTIDVRHLEMPQPMVQILERLSHMPENEALFVHHKKKPIFLFPELESRGFDYALKTIREGEVDMLIYKYEFGKE